MPLTTLANVHKFLRLPDAVTAHDALLNLLIAEVTSQIEQRAQRKFDSASYVETLDGWDTVTLWLAQGPLLTITTVEELTYSATGVTAVVVDANLYRGLGIGTYTGDARGGIERTDGSTWAAGRGRWRVTYTAGYATIPPALELDAIRLVVAHFRRSDVEGLVSEGRDDLSTVPIDVAELDRLTERIAGQWRLRLSAT